MNKVVNIITFPLKLICFLLIYMYKWCIAPILPHTCMLYPTCSNYMLIAIREHGVFKGVALGISRLRRCSREKHNICDEDYVPLNIKGDSKWII